MQPGQFIKDLKSDIEKWLKDRTEIYSNERHLQVELASYLNNLNKYDKIILEYRIPNELIQWLMKSFNSTLPWKNSSNYFVDIVIEKENMFIPIELKYGTREIDNIDFKIFGQSFINVPKDIKKQIVILKNQAASSLTMYNFWKDVRRLEVMSSIFENVIGGIALLVANPTAYREEPQKNAGYKEYSTHHENRKSKIGKWGANISQDIIKGHPDFNLDQEYDCLWEKTGIVKSRKNKEERFYYLLVTVNK